MKRRALVLGVLLSAGVLLAAEACGPGDLSDLTRGSARPAATPTPDADAVPRLCENAVEPERPTGPDGPTQGELLFAMDDLRFDMREEDVTLPRPEGLDLDRACTCPEVPSCVGHADGGPCDDARGRDNAAAKLFTQLGEVVPSFGPGFARERMRDGVFSALFGVQGWNGRADDPDVIVSVRFSAGTEGVQSDAGRTLPKHDGKDVWTVDPASLLGGDTLTGQDCRSTLCLASHVDRSAYVKDGTLVAHLDLPLTIGTPTGFLVAEFTAATLTARIDTATAVPTITGEIAGRWSVANLLGSISGIKDPITGMPLCGSNPTYASVKQVICESLDIAADPAKDMTGARCDAISQGVTFHGVAAQIGTVFRRPQESTGCPARDACP